MSPIELAVDGRRLEAAWWTPRAPAGVPLVLLHDGLGSVRRWRQFPADLAERTGRCVFAYSRFGHGSSDAAAGRRSVDFVHEEAALVPAVLAAAGTARAALLGHSDGGSIALVAAAEHRALVDALILEAPHVFVEEISVASVERTTESFQTTNLRDRLGRYHDDVDAAFGHWSGVWLDAGFRDWNIEALLNRIACPVLAIQGVDDEYGTLLQLDAIERHVRGPFERLVLDDCGHTPHRDQPEAVLGAIRDFIDRHAPG